jgi:antitoxin (DNA-binding transcriptional repressor) of toxin-antitoxin stability system
MTIVTIPTGKSTLAQLLARVEAGEEIILARGKSPIAKLAPFQPPRSKRRFGALRGVITVGPEFFGPLPPAELEGWDG